MECRGGETQKRSVRQPDPKQKQGRQKQDQQQLLRIKAFEPHRLSRNPHRGKTAGVGVGVELGRAEAVHEVLVDV